MDFQILIVVAAVAGSLLYLIPKIVGKAGIGRAKPDCGCGHCIDRKGPDNPQLGSPP
jgi:hypothetical protein